MIKPTTFLEKANALLTTLLIAGTIITVGITFSLLLTLLVTG